jgi:hypothetical protein
MNAKKKTAASEAAESQVKCLCMGMGPKLTELLECRSQAAADHFRSSRVEFLKAIRTLIDERIERLSQPRRKGTAVPVE